MIMPRIAVADAGALVASGNIWQIARIGDIE
jgi:hypothetical protein